jgi:hypothetical protein
MNIDKLHDLKSALEAAALTAKQMTDNAVMAGDAVEKTRWRGLYTQYQKWVDMLTEAMKD